MDINLLSIIFSIFLIITAPFYYIFKALEAKGKIHVFSYSMRKLFMDELEEASDRVFDLFKKRLSKNSKKDAAITLLIGISIFVIIILPTILVPVNLNIVIAKSTINYFFVIYNIDFVALYFLLLTSIIWGNKIYDLGMLGKKQPINRVQQKTDGDKLEVSHNERKMIRLYHFIKYSTFISTLLIFVLFIQILLVSETLYPYYHTNPVIEIISLILFAILGLSIFVIERLRIIVLYDAEDFFFMRLTCLPETHKMLLLKTSSNGIFPDKPHICFLGGVGSKLKIIYQQEGKIFFSYIRWKDVVAFGFHHVKQEEVFQKLFEENEMDVDHKTNN